MVGRRILRRASAAGPERKRKSSTAGDSELGPGKSAIYCLFKLPNDLPTPEECVVLKAQPPAGSTIRALRSYLVASLPSRPSSLPLPSPSPVRPGR